MTFCRFGFDEQLTLEDLRLLIDRKELGEKDLLLVGDAKDWTPARDIPELKGLFPVVERVEPAPRRPAPKLPPKPLPPLPQLERHPYRPRPILLIAVVAGAVMLLVQILGILRSISRGQALDCATLFTFFFWMLFSIVAVSIIRARM